MRDILSILEIRIYIAVEHLICGVYVASSWIV